MPMTTFVTKGFSNTTLREVRHSEVLEQIPENSIIIESENRLYGMVRFPV